MKKRYAEIPAVPFAYNLFSPFFLSGWLATFQAFNSEADQRLMSVIAGKIIARFTEIYPKRKISPQIHHYAADPVKNLRLNKVIWRRKLSKARFLAQMHQFNATSISNNPLLSLTPHISI